MARTLMFLVYASLLSCGLTTTVPSGSTTIVPTHTTTTVHATTVHTLAPTPVTGPTTPVTRPPRTESPALVENNTFILYDERNNEICLIMKANMTVTYTYINASTNKTVTQLDPIDGLAEIVYNDRSFCQLNGNVAKLTLQWMPKDGEADPHTITFTFGASYKKGSKHWTFDAVHLRVVYSKVDFPDYKGPANDILYNSSGFFDTDIVEFERGYQCLSSQEHKLHNLTDHNITASLTVRDFQVQAFVFKKPGEFTNFRKCLADSGNGKKIVPIAVGVALAVLVIIVFIAFIISKLVNKRKTSSYETLN